MRFETAGNGSKNRIFTPFGDFYIDVENLFDQVLGNKNCSNTSQAGSDTTNEQHSAPKGDYRPACNVIESEKAFTASFDLPGVDAEDVNIELLDQELKVSGTRKPLVASEGDRILQSSSTHGKFDSVLRFETLVDSDNVEASFDAGVLTVVIPKTAKPVPKKIQIKTKVSSNTQA